MLEWNKLGDVTHAQAREILAAAFREIFGRDGTLPELQIAQAISLGESYYGNAGYRNRATGEVVRNTNNWTAQQCGVRPPCPPTCFEATDTRANGEPYQACFRLFATPEEGAARFLTILYKQRPGGPDVLAAASRGDYKEVSRLMRSHGYFELPLAKHQQALSSNIDRVAKALGEPRATTSSADKVRWPLYLGVAGIVTAAITFPSWRRAVGI